MLLTTACKGGGPTTPAATTGALTRKIEAKTCSTQGSFDIEVFVDHVLVGTRTFMVGTTVPFTVTAGNHTLGGRASDGRFSWGYETIFVPAGGEYTAQFACM